MADDLKNPGPEDGRLISLAQVHEVAYWCEELNCTEEELATAVDKVGNSAKAVREFLTAKN